MRPERVLTHSAMSPARCCRGGPVLSRAGLTDMFAETVVKFVIIPLAVASYRGHSVVGQIGLDGTLYAGGTQEVLTPDSRKHGTTVYQGRLK